ALASKRAELAAKEKRQDKELHLLARAADDRNGLQLKPYDDAFTIATGAMTGEERALMRSPWTTAALRIGHHLALALDRLRSLAADLLLREGRIIERETELRNLNALSEERARQHALDVQNLEERHRSQKASNALARHQLSEREK